MRSLLLVLTVLPLASFSLPTGHINEVGNSTHNNGTTWNKYWLQQRHEGDTFFKYADARVSFLTSPC